MIHVELQNKGQHLNSKIYIVDKLKQPLLSGETSEKLNIVRMIQQLSSNFLNPKREFPEIFNGLGHAKINYKISLQPDAKPYALCTPRRVPIPLMKQVKEQLEEMTRLGVIESVEETTEWCAGMVAVSKPGGKIRICVDLTKLNQYIRRENYPLPATEHILGQLGNACYFSKLDANSGFWQFGLAKESQKLTTFITPFGRFFFKRIPFGITLAPEIFQRKMTQLLGKIEGVVCFMDDIVAYGSSLEEHNERVSQVLKKIQEEGMTLNPEKCQFGVKTVKFLGHTLSSEGLFIDEEKLDAITKMEAPRSTKELKSFLGMVNYLGKFIPNLADKLQPLNSLLSTKNEWVWDEPQKKSFNLLKQELVSRPNLALFDPSRTTIVSADASSFGLGGVLRQEQPDGSLKPIAYVSRTLSETEKRYSQIEKEGLAIVWTCDRLKDYVTGIEIHIETDHKPLIAIFTSKSLEDMTPRLQRLKMRMMRYSYQISHIAGKKQIVADMLSRKPMSKPHKDELEEELSAYIQSIEFPATEETLLEISRKQKEDSLCSQLAKYCMSGWPKNKREVDPALRGYWQFQEDLTYQNGLLLRGQRILIPKSLRKDILEKLHQGHFGINKCRSRAKESVWYPEISLLQNLTAQDVISHLKSIFARHGTPETVRSDNGPQFQKVLGSEFSKFSKEWSFKHITSSPKFPQSNGFIEAIIKNIKQSFKKEEDCYLTLQAYRTMPLESGYSPAELLMGRRFRTSVPAIESSLMPRRNRLHLTPLPKMGGTMDASEEGQRQKQRNEETPTSTSTRLSRRCKDDQEQQTEEDCPTPTASSTRDGRMQRDNQDQDPEKSLPSMPAVHTRYGRAVKIPRRRFERFRQASGLINNPENEQVNMLVYCMGDNADDILLSCKIASDQLENYNKVIECFESHFIPRRNIIYERARFNQRCQQEGEKVNEFITALHSLAEHCNFEMLHDELIRVRIVVGVRDRALSERMQLDTDLTLVKATLMAKQLESVKEQQSSLYQQDSVDQIKKMPNHIKVAKRHEPKIRQFKSSQLGGSLHGCTRCGNSNNHDWKNCPAMNSYCSKCKKKGHYAKVCRSEAINEIKSEIAFLGSIEDNSKKWIVPIKVNNRQINFKIDTGADVNVLPLQYYYQSFQRIKLEKSDKILQGPNGIPLETVGMIHVELQNKGQHLNLKIYIVDKLKQPLLSGETSEKLNIVRMIQQLSSNFLNPKREFPEIFNGLGHAKINYKISLQPDAKPYALCTPRRVPIPLMKQVKEQLEEMTRLGVIDSVEEPTEWCAEMVAVSKPGGKIRICVDLTKLNQYIRRENYPLPATEHILGQLGNACYFSKLDANSGFWQFGLAKESQKLTTFITPFGRFFFKRIPFGITSAPEIFQRKMTQLLGKIEGVVSFMDDIVVNGSSLEEHNERVRQVLKKIQEEGLTLNPEKCQFGVKTVQFLGHTLSSEGLFIDEEKLDAITKMEAPRSTKELKSFLGMVNYLGKFIPNLADKLQPLNSLLSTKNEWVWDEPQKKSFNLLKQELVSRPNLALFDPSRTTIVSADASSFGLGGVLRQEQPDGSLKPIAYVSRTLSETEKRYSQIGHRKNECTNNTAEDGGQEENQRKSKKACYTCGEFGHKKDDCPKSGTQESGDEEESSDNEEEDKSKKKEEDCYLTLQAHRTMPLESARSREMRRPPLRHQPGSQGDARMTRSKRPRRIALHQRPHLQEMEGCRWTTKTRIQRRAPLQCQPCIQDGRAVKIPRRSL
ncbi:K02A2.6-like [Cordylochernes scorpioides]|uniref:RNA-directed DNA polymerase n=1 Tax=Cordylochernes scorpioides TaxID=51811 RepID=A0ABY6L3T9_9ARAC|nr:K02A2.6-like [Cordylochernes scorpioides]